MKERGIIMQAHSVRAILDGRKTQFRRVIKPQPIYDPDGTDSGFFFGKNYCYLEDARYPRVNPKPNSNCLKWCPFGKAGDRLWVRETFFAYDKDVIHYKADNNPEIAKVAAENGLWQSSATMPRWASRLTLEICSIRVQRLQEISAEDCRAEGTGDWPYPICVDVFSCWWKQQYGKKSGCAWADNPWVWAISFRQVTP